MYKRSLIKCWLLYLAFSLYYILWLLTCGIGELRITARGKCGWANVIWCAIYMNKGKLCRRIKINNCFMSGSQKTTKHLVKDRWTSLPWQPSRDNQRTAWLYISCFSDHWKKTIEGQDGSPWSVAGSWHITPSTFSTVYRLQPLCTQKLK